MRNAPLIGKPTGVVLTVEVAMGQVLRQRCIHDALPCVIGLQRQCSSIVPVCNMIQFLRCRDSSVSHV